jgi:hypothetical protein
VHADWLNGWGRMSGDAAFEAMQRETVQPEAPMLLFSRLLYGFQAASTAMRKYPPGSLSSVTSHLRILRGSIRYESHIKANTLSIHPSSNSRQAAEAFRTCPAATAYIPYLLRCTFSCNQALEGSRRLSRWVDSAITRRPINVAAQQS